MCVLGKGRGKMLFFSHQKNLCSLPISALATLYLQCIYWTFYENGLPGLRKTVSKTMWQETFKQENMKYNSDLINSVSKDTLLCST